MSSNNTFSLSRFLLLCRHQVAQNGKLLLFGSVGYCGVIFVILYLAQFDHQTNRLDVQAFLPMMISLVAVFGILYNGYAFPSFRTKEKSISYLTIPASVFEKFLFEFISRVLVTLTLLPVLFWVTFNVGGHVIDWLLSSNFASLSIGEVYEEFGSVRNYDQIKWAFILASLLTFVLPFTGAAFFSKQPLIKTLFSVGLLIMCYSGLIYIIAEPLGLNQYRISEDPWLIPRKETEWVKFLTSFLLITNLVMIVVSYLKLKEKEV